MDSVNCVNCQQPRTENRYKGVRHFANNAATLAGVGATGLLFNNGMRLANNVCGDAIALSNGSKIIATKTAKVFGFFEKMGDKIFKDGTKLGNAIKRYVTGQLPTGGVMAEPKQIAAVMKKCKTIGAMGIAAGIALLGILLKGQYNAGKIDGQQ